MAATEYAYAFVFEGREYRLEKFLLSEARAVQRATGKTIQEFDEALKRGDADCLAALVWVARKREQPTLRFDEVDGDIMTFKPLPTSADDAAGEAGPGEQPGTQSTQSA